MVILTPLLVLLAGFASPPQESLPLFDGATLDGWSGDPKFWSVEDGEIVGRSTPEVPCQRSTWLVWEGADVQDFDLRVDVRITGGNSGVQYRSRHRGNWQVHGPQADVDAPGTWTGGIYEQGGRGVLVRRGVIQERRDDLAGDVAIDGVFGVEGLVDATEWGTLRVRCVGPVTELFWNGRLTSRLNDASSKHWNDAGGIALQLHAGPPMEVRFKNIELRELPPGSTPETAGFDLPDEAPEPEPVADDPDGARWIWAPGDPSQQSSARLVRDVELRGALRKATLWGTCDNGVDVYVGAERVAASDDWTAAFERDVTEAFAGTRKAQLRAECTNQGGPGGLVLKLALEYEDGARETIVTDGSWRTIEGAPAQDLGPLGMAPWGVPATRAGGAPLGVLPADELILPPGFEAELLYEVPRSKGSWVAVEVDDMGRIYCADERDKGLFRIVPIAGGMRIDALDVDLPAAQGLLPLRREDGGIDLYVMVNAFGSERANGLWRATDKEDDGTFESLELLMEVEGAGEHGAHAIRRAPDGSGLYVIAGNHVKLPADIETYHAPPLWAEDQLLPRLPDPRGHAVGIPVPGGWFMKLDRDGGTRQLVAIGMRNAYDFAFDSAGNALTYDSDMEWDMGTPWYRAPRILQLEPGADFGWRHGSGKVPDWAPDTRGSVVDTGPASPTGVIHTKDLAFHAPWNDALLAADWAYGTVHAVTTRPEVWIGDRNLTGEIRPFIQGRPFPVTDLAAHPDGSLIVTIGGRGTRSAVYVVRSVVEGVRRTVASVPDPIALWRQPGVPSTEPYPPSGDVSLTSAADAGAYFLDRVRRGEAELEALMVHVGFHASHPESRGDPEGMLPLLRALEVALARADDRGAAARRVRASTRRAGADLVRPFEELESWYPSGDRRVDRSLATLLTALGSEAFTPRAVARMLRPDTQEDALHLAYCLRVHEAGWTPELIDAYLTFLHVDAQQFRGGASLPGYVANIRDEATERLAPLVPGGWTPPAAGHVTASAPRIAGNTFVKEWAMADLLPAKGELADRDHVSGRRAFESARCAECHRFRGEGGATGPDLSGAASRYTPQDLLTAILEPSRDLTDQYQDTEVWTTDGVVHLGRVVEEDAEWLTLMPPPPDEDERIDVAQSEVKVRRPHPTSRMPAGLLNGLTRREALDLVAYLLTAETGPGEGEHDPAEYAAAERANVALEASLANPSLPGFDALRRAFAGANSGYDLHWHGALDECDASDGPRVLFIQSGEGSATVVPFDGGEEEASPLRVGDIVTLRKGERMRATGDLAALVYDVPAPPPADLPTFIRPDFDPNITDTPGGCAEEMDAYRRILLTWQGKVGPYLYHAINAHRVRILDSFTHYHPKDGGFDEFYLVQSAPEGAELIVSEQLDVILGVAAVTRADVEDVIRRIPLRAGSLVYLPRGVVHRGVGGAVVQVITVPGFVPGAEIGVDQNLMELNARFELEGDEALPVHRR